MTLDLKQFYGTDQFYKHPLWKNIVYTDGIQYVAQKAGAYWLIDSIAGHLMSDELKRAAKKDFRLTEMIFWNLKVNEDTTALLTATADSDVEPWLRHEIPFTDFPLDSLDIWTAWNGQSWTLMLKTEY